MMSWGGVVTSQCHQGDVTGGHGDIGGVMSQGGVVMSW